ncbi:cation diffusion facilitator family transporter [Cryptosporangium arvum]|uniref:cation diffusion facilitator family transporter n=1 Tax=Cryptosporangium arvum TaxID=80871 RepID=UPI0004B464CE|nr:cation diffusion facilitator family transporter [Cryptosporangium arvum]
MAHDHAHHDHSISPNADRRWLITALSLIVVFMVGEVIVGLIAESLALLSDAAHMLTDAAAIVLALIAMRLAARPPKGNFTFGLRRVEILSAQVNGITLWVLAAVFVVEAIDRFRNPPDVAGGLVLATAVVGIGVNALATWAISRADRRSLNVEGAFQHLLNDLFAFIATAVAGAIVLFTGWARADAIATLLVAISMAWAGWGLLRDSWRVFLEAAPRGLDVARIDGDLHAVDGVVDVHDLHVWEVTSGFPNLSAHLLLAKDQDCHTRREEIAALLAERYGIRHTTLQVDHAQERLIDPADLRPGVAREATPH